MSWTLILAHPVQDEIDIIHMIVADEATIDDHWVELSGNVTFVDWTDGNRQECKTDSTLRNCRVPISSVGVLEEWTDEEPSDG